MAHILVGGLGDLGQDLARRWHGEGHRVSGIRRRNEPVPDVDLYAQDLAKDPVILPPDQIDLLYLILTPRERSVEGYQDAYITAPRRLLEAIAARQPAPPVIFVSSTAVYGDHSGEMDEETPPRPTRFNGRILLAAEEEISVRSLATIVRFSGIYGPGRQRLLRQVNSIREGEAPPSASWTNRIHREDCVSLLLHLGRRWLQGDMPPPLVIGTDLAPSLNVSVLNWLAEQTGAPLALPEPDIAPGKRLHSRYIEKDRNFELAFPDFRSGYAMTLREDSGQVTR